MADAAAAAARAASRAAARAAIRGFNWAEYGMDDLATALDRDPAAQEWVDALATLITAAVNPTMTPGTGLRLEELHTNDRGFCVTCGGQHPCLTVQLVRGIAQDGD